MSWRQRIRPNDIEALENPSAKGIAALESLCGPHDSSLMSLRKALVGGSERAAFAQLQIIKDKWGRAGGEIHRLEEELVARMRER